MREQMFEFQEEKFKCQPLINILHTHHFQESAHPAFHVVQIPTKESVETNFQTVFDAVLTTLAGNDILVQQRDTTLQLQVGLSAQLRPHHAIGPRKK